MNLQTLQNFLNSLIRTSLVGTPPAPLQDLDPPFEASRTWITTQFPGIGVYVPTGAESIPWGGPLGEELFSLFVDMIPMPQSAHVGSGVAASDVVRNIFDLASVIEGARGGPAAADLLEALEAIYPPSHPGESGRREESPPLVRHQESAARFRSALFRYNALGWNRPQTVPDRWPVISAVARQKVDAAGQEYRGSLNGPIGNWLRIIRREATANVDLVLDVCSSLYRGATSPSLYSLGSEYHPSHPIPSDWYAQGEHQHVTLRSDQVLHFEPRTGLGPDPFSPPFTIPPHRPDRLSLLRRGDPGAGGGGGVQPDAADDLLWRIDDRAGGQPTWLSGDIGTQYVRFSFDIGLVQVRRPWFPGSLFSAGGWRMEGQLPGSVSSGSIQTPRGLMPMLPVAYVVVRDLTIEARWGVRDSTVLAQATEGRRDVAFGPFSLSASAEFALSGTSTRLTSSFDGINLRVPGTQIVAWVNELVAFSPVA